MPDRNEIIVAGRIHIVTGVELYPNALLAEWRQLKARAQQQLNGVSTGLGLFGSPGWVIGGTVVLSALESLLSSAAAKDGLHTLKQANAALARARSFAKTFPVSEIRDILLPCPAAWLGIGKRQSVVDITRPPRDQRGVLLEQHDAWEDDLVDGKLVVSKPAEFTCIEDDFLSLDLVRGGLTSVRWSSIELFRPFDVAETGTHTDRAAHTGD